MAEISKDRWYVIINPVAGFGLGLTDFPRISKLLREYGIEHDFSFTEHRHHATELTVKAVRDGYRQIVAAGGDGTLNEIVNGLFLQDVVPPTDIKLGIIAIGTGNDWARMFGIPQRYSEAIQALKEGHTFLQDVGRVTYSESQYSQTRYLANVAGLGFDAQVVNIYNHLKSKGKRGKWMYASAIIKSFFGYKPKGVRIVADGKVIYQDLLFSIAVGICKYNGGGIQQLPNAVADDGLLDITMIRPIHWWNIVFRMSKLVNGDIYDIGHIIHAQAKNIEITAAPLIDLETDGEIQGETPVKIEALHRAIKVVVSKDFLKS